MNEFLKERCYIFKTLKDDENINVTVVQFIKDFETVYKISKNVLFIYKNFESVRTDKCNLISDEYEYVKKHKSYVGAWIKISILFDDIIMTTKLENFSSNFLSNSDEISISDLSDLLCTSK